MLKIPACGLPNPAVSFKKAYRKQGEFAPLLTTTDRRDHFQPSIDKKTNKSWWKGFQPNHQSLKTKLSRCSQLKSIFLPAADNVITCKLANLFQPDYEDTASSSEDEDWDMYEMDSLDAWTEGSPLLEEQHCKLLNKNERSRGAISSLRRKVSAKCRKLEYTFASIPSFFHRLVYHRGQNSYSAAPSSSDHNDECLGYQFDTKR